MATFVAHSGDGLISRRRGNCRGCIGVFCLEASRLARNGRDWHHLLELCGLVGARVFDVDGVYDPSHPNDRLLLGLKGTMSEFELTIMRRRLLDAALAKARRGELRFGVPIGLVWEHGGKIELDPDRRIQDALRTVFRLFDRLGSARKVLLRMHADGLLFPRPADGKRLTRGQIEWRPPSSIRASGGDRRRTRSEEVRPQSPDGSVDRAPARSPRMATSPGRSTSATRSASGRTRTANLPAMRSRRAVAGRCCRAC